MPFKPFDVVRVRQLLRPADDDYDDWRTNERAPRVGDVGTVVEVLHAPGWPDKYVVEATNPEDGTNIWLSDFTADEIEPVSS